MPTQLAPVTLQMTTLSVVPLTVTWNCKLPLSGTWALLGESESETAAIVEVAKKANHKKVAATTKWRFMLSTPQRQAGVTPRRYSCLPTDGVVETVARSGVVFESSV